jgi:hypothetical protein
MPPSPRYTVRLPPALDALVQERIHSSGTPFALLVRAALSAYLADIPPTGTPTDADRSADRSADTIEALQAQLVGLTKRVAAIEHMLTRLRRLADRSADSLADRLAAYADTPPTPADSGADTPLTSADTPTPLRRRGTMRARILALLQEHQGGLTADEIRFYLKPERPLGDVLQGMVRQGLVVRQGDRKGGCYVARQGGPVDD